MKRFYKDVSVASSPPTLEGEGGRKGAYAILLDGKPIRTPARAALTVPTRALAEAIAEEWRRQGETLMPQSMPLTRLANTAIDLPTLDRGKFVNQVLAFGNSEFLCYRAEASEALAVRQRATWDPVLDWLAQRHGARLTTGVGLGFVEQPGEAQVALDKAVWSHDDFMLAALHSAATVTGSLALALALADARLDARAAFAASTLDESFQAEYWGHDAQAQARRARLSAELAATERFMRLLKNKE